MMVLKAACTSALEQVLQHVLLQDSDGNCPCQSEVLRRRMFSGSWLSEMRMQFSWSYTVLGICSWLGGSGQCLLSRLLTCLCGFATCSTFRDVLQPQQPTCCLWDWGRG